MTSKLLKSLGAFGFLAATACTTVAPSTSGDHWGTQEERANFVPARTAIFPCQKWPATLRAATLPLSNAKDDDFKQLCLQVDQFVLEGFKSQPYMRGLTPKFVQKLADTEKRPTLVNDATNLLAEPAPACKNCQTPAGVYNQMVRTKSGWIKYLADFSTTIRGTDAVLLPFITAAWDDERDDRGLIEKRRGAAITLLLVDTASGQLIWSGGHEAMVAAKDFNQPSRLAALKTPGWDAVMPRLLTNTIWRAYPGRQEQ